MTALFGAGPRFLYEKNDFLVKAARYYEKALQSEPENHSLKQRIETIKGIMEY